MPTACRLAHWCTVLPCSSRVPRATAMPDRVELVLVRDEWGTRRVEERLPSSASQCKTTSKVTVSGRRSGKKNKTHVRVVDYEGYAERRIAAPLRYRRWAPCPGRRAGSTGSTQQGCSPSRKGWSQLPRRTPRATVAGAVAG